MIRRNPNKIAMWVPAVEVLVKPYKYEGKAMPHNRGCRYFEMLE
jgi:hypothetical protein